MLAPSQTVIPRSTEVTGTFLGYNHNLRIADGEFYEMENLTSDAFPVMRERPARGFVRSLPGAQCLAACDTDITVCGGVLYLGGVSMEPYMGEERLEPGEKQIVQMGLYACVFPDGYYFNTGNYYDHGFMHNRTQVEAGVTPVQMRMCTSSGTYMEISYTQSSPPERPNNGDYWLDTSATPHSLKVFSAYTAQWTSVPTSYVRLEATGIGKGFRKEDCVTVFGLEGTQQIAALNGAHTLWGVSNDLIVIEGLIDAAFTQETGSVSVIRQTPRMDFVTECGNRLWGCRCGTVDGKPVNELYCCRLGDFCNWENFRGTADDAWVAVCGSQGPFTGAATFGDSPIFFKEDCMHRVYPSASGAHRVVTVRCEGVQAGSHRSVAAVDGRLYYKAGGGVYVYDGSLPELISEALGPTSYGHAAAGSVRGKYWISMQSGDGVWSLFVYDTRRRLWHREDSLHVRFFARVGDELYALDERDRILALLGTDGLPEREIAWSAQTGTMVCGLVGKKYVSRLNLRMILPAGSSCDVWLEYDSGGVWKHAGHVTGRGMRTFLLPIRPARCDHLRMKLTGRGSVRLLSLARVVEAGSDG